MIPGLIGRQWGGADKGDAARGEERGEAGASSIESGR
jgi:hypothetical protein